MPSTTDTPAPLVAGQYPGFQTSEACDNPMVEPAKPLPWQVRYGDTVADATGAKVAMAKGLQKGARLLRRWRRFSHLGRVHPVKFCVAALLLVPNLAIALSLYYLGRFGNWLSRGENAGERYAAWWGRWSEPDREHELRIRAWFGKRKKGGAS